MHVYKDSMWRRILKNFTFLGGSKQGVQTCDESAAQPILLLLACESTRRFVWQPCTIRRGARTAGRLAAGTGNHWDPGRAGHACPPAQAWLCCASLLIVNAFALAPGRGPGLPVLCPHYCHQACVGVRQVWRLDQDEKIVRWALVSKKFCKIFQVSRYIDFFRRVHRVLNIDENKN